MALRGHVFDKQLFANECFALFIDTFLGNKNGIINGCAVSNTTSAVSLASGYFCIQGRFLQEVGGSTFNVSASDTTLYQQLICEIDLSKTNTYETLNQAYYKILSSDSGYQTLTQQDITTPGQIYQFEFARWQVGSSGISNFQDKRTMLDFDSIYSEVRTTFNELIADIQQEEIDFFDDLNTQAQSDYADFTSAMEGLETQFEGYIDDLKSDADKALDDALTEYESEFETWFETIKDILDSSTAGHLQNEIDTLSSNKEDKSNKVTSIDENSTDTQYPSAKLLYDQLLTKEAVANKVTSISSSSTDTQYPSAKAVNDFVVGKEDIKGTFTIETTDWSAVTGRTDDYTVKATINITGVTANDIPDIYYTEATKGIAEEAGADLPDTVSGGLDIYAVSTPSASISGTYIIKKVGGA